RADVTRRMPPHPGDRCQGRVLSGGGEAAQAFEPTGGCHVYASTGSAAVFTRWTDQKTASGVAGEARVTGVPETPNAPAASRSASRNANASMRGGSPTAFEPYT